MIFVDTGAWFAAIVPTDPNHQRAASFLATNREPLITTDYVVDETLTLLRARGERQRALLLGERFFSGRLAEIYYLTEEDVQQAWEVLATTPIRIGVSPTAPAKVSLKSISSPPPLLSTRTSSNSGLSMLSLSIYA